MLWGNKRFLIRLCFKVVSGKGRLLIHNPTSFLRQPPLTVNELFRANFYNK
jgi:hypothetical protein